ncbi:hypothetical protein BDP27DRAFT_1315668 [Rhodocollybia butyracea]|uniref:Uncharacterized protein n=1 Tax=Rhodocollybia butyracea TaxID=206335 RepID=A0A9P5UDI2_9AGAR|nr:hypothetical protein BDP27DRAFT_1315668 [Rhodocollybia butyracea]
MKRKVSGSSQHNTSPSTPKKNASTEMLFGETGLTKGSSPVKYGSRTKTAKTHSSSPRNPDSIRIQVPDASPQSPTRKRHFLEDSDIELSPLTPLTPKAGFSRIAGSKSTEGWRIEDLGEFVWVRVDEQGHVFDMEAANEGEFRWWPARSIETDRNQIIVCPYGTLGSVSTIRIQNPSVHNILSLTDSLGRPRFNTSSSDTSTSFSNSPKKKLKRSLPTIEANWQDAVCEILRAKEEEEDDGLPPIEFALSAASRFASASAAQSTATSPKRSKGKGKAKSQIQAKSYSDEEVIEVDELESDWDAPEPDELLDIPGELVLARDKADRNVAHWPAKVLAYLPPPKPKGKSRHKEPKYRVLFLDDTQKEVAREWFYASHEPEFGTCQVGKFDSQYADNPPDADEDVSDSTQTATSPSPVPVPSLSYAFGDLSIRAQLGYIKPVLIAILNESYPPAKGRHDSFMKGGKARAGLGASAGMRGTIPPQDIDRLQKYLCDWCLRHEIGASGDSEEMLDVLTDVERHSLEHIANAASTSKLTISGSITPSTTKPNAKENIDPDEEDAGRFVSSKELTSDLRASPVPTEGALTPPSTLPPSSSVISLLSDDDEIEISAPEPIPLKRQQGCPAYEKLTGVEKITYCLNILLPEAVLQLLLWRNGLRTSIELLSVSEESELHGTAEKLAEETDWVFDVMRLRDTKVRQMQRKQAAASASRHRSRASSRPRRYH